MSQKPKLKHKQVLKWLLRIGYVIGMLLLYYMAVIYRSRALLFMAFVFAIVPLAELLLMLLQRRHISVKYHIMNRYVTLGQSLKGSIQIKNDFPFPVLALHVETGIIDSDLDKQAWNREIHSLSEKKWEFAFALSNCGKYQWSIQSVRLSDWLGLFSLPIAYDDNVETIYCYPTLCAKPALSLALGGKQESEEEIEQKDMRGVRDQFVGIREYIPGDALRNIHWKLTARTGNMMVKEYASNTSVQGLCFIDLSALYNKSPEERDVFYEYLLGSLDTMIKQQCYVYVAFCVNWGQNLKRILLSDENKMYELLLGLYDVIWECENTITKHRVSKYSKHEIVSLYEQQYEAVEEENVLMMP